MECLHLHLLLWICEKYLDPLDVNILRLTSKYYCRIPKKTCDPLCEAISYGYSGVVSWLLKTNCKVSVKAFLLSSVTGSITITEKLAKSWPEILQIDKADHTIPNETALHGQIDMVLWQISNGWTIDKEKICEYAAASGNLTLLKTLINRKYQLSDHTICLAALSGNLSMVKWIMSNGGDIQDCTLVYSVCSGDLETVSFIYQAAAPEHKIASVTEEAAKYVTNLDDNRWAILKYLLEAGCNYDDKMWIILIESNAVSAIKYLVDNNYKRQNKVSLLKRASSRKTELN